ncbi:MAG: rod-binding protein, partial [Rhizobiales bacterium]|nr:rod-binding protein [Hyphomicrobiales bacterium]
EAVFLNSMFQQMFTSIEGEGPFGGGPAAGVWRSLLTDEYAKSFTKQGGIGIADQVYRSLIAAQEARAR